MPETKAKAGFSRHAKPIVSALENYRKDHLEYPLALTNLYPTYLSANDPLSAGSWSITYERNNPTNYFLRWRGGLSYADFQPGGQIQYGSYVGH